MERVCCRPLLLAAVLLGIAPPRTFAQTPAPTPPAPASSESAQADPLPELPRPPDAPRSLFRQPAPTPSYACDPLPGAYFEPDSRLDPPSLPPPGWFADVELGVVAPHIKNRLADMVRIPGSSMSDTVHVPGAELDWTVAPRVEVGYRLPTGFGEFAVAYRFFGTDGSGVTTGSDSAALLKSRLSVNIVDMDYASRQFTYFPNWGMKWRFGLRWADAFFDSRADEPFAAAAAGSGVFETRTSNNFWGLGPHGGLELARRFDSSGLALIGRIDGATLLGRIRQNFFEASTAPAPSGQRLTGNTRQTVDQNVPIIDAFIGVSWQPPRYQYAHIAAGYQFEYWWNVGRNSDTMSRGDVGNQGILLRAEFNY